MAGEVNQFEKLCDPLLLIIMSSLPFKEAARTCILSKRWRHLWHATKNIEFNESFFVKDDDSEGNREIQRKVFINFVSEWIINFREPVVDNLFLTFSRPGESLLVLNLSVNCIKFALAHNVKVLGLDFSDPAWEEYNLHSHPQESFNLPLDVYQHRALKSLKLFSCKFCVSDLSNLCMLRHLSLGWVGLRPSSLKTLLVNCELLESLSLKRCWGIGFLQIEAESLPLKTLVVDKCDFTESSLIVEAPKLRFLKYAGMLPTFDLKVGRCMEEADLDVGYGGDEFVEPGDIIQQLFCDLYSIKVLTVCSYILQVIPTGQEPVGMEPSLTVVHLTLKTSLHDNEFWGIKFMLNSCCYLEKLTIEIDSKHSRILPGYDPPFREPWSLCTIVYKCIKRSLKVVEVKGFKGDSNEAYLLNYVIVYGRVMEKLNIYLSKEVNANGNEGPEVYLRRAQRLSQLRKASPRLRMLIFS